MIADLLAGDRGYRVIQRLPGIGPVLAAVIIAEIGDVTRFRTAAQLASWAGLTPGHRESDIKVTRGHVTKQGSRLLRWAPIEAIQRSPAGFPARDAKDAIIARRGTGARNIAKVAAARRMLTLCLLRAARRPDPLRARTSKGRVRAAAPAGREAAHKSVPRPMAAWTPT